MMINDEKVDIISDQALGHIDEKTKGAIVISYKTDISMAIPFNTAYSKIFDRWNWC